MSQPAHIARMSDAELEACREVIREIARGANLGEYLADIGMTTIRFYELAETTPELTAAYARAKRARAELVAQEIVAIADSEQDAQRARNRIQARQWYASKILPREYGDRMEVNVTQTIDIGSALADARARALRPVCDQRQMPVAQVVDYTEVIDLGPADEQSNGPRLAPDPPAPRPSLTARASQAGAPAPAKRGRRPKGSQP